MSNVMDKPVTEFEKSLARPHVNPEFTKDRLENVHKIIAKYEQSRSALLPVLYVAQEQFGYLSEPVMTYVANLLGMQPREVKEAVTFYTMYRQKDMGRVCLQVCQNITCTMMGSDDLMKVIREELNIERGQVTPDKQFSFLTVECLGSCGTAPVVQVNDDYFEDLTPEKFRALIRRWKSGETPTSQSESSGTTH